MKKIVFLSGVLVLAGCASGGSSISVNEQSSQSLSDESVDSTLVQEEPSQISQDDLNSNVEFFGDGELRNVLIPMTEEQFVTVENMPNSFFGDKYRFRGSADLDVDKIIVEFENPTSQFPKDVFELPKYKKGSGEWTYEGEEYYKIMDVGLNIYTVRAFKGNEESSLRILLMNLPNSYATDPDTGLLHPSDGKMREFQIYSIEQPLDTEGITDFVLEAYSKSYWHTSRPIQNDGFSFFVLTSNGDQKFEYKKVYFIPFDDKNYIAEVLIDQFSSPLLIEDINGEYSQKSREKSFDQDIQEKIADADAFVSQIKTTRDEIEIDMDIVRDRYNQEIQGK